MILLPPQTGVPTVLTEGWSTPIAAAGVGVNVGSWVGTSVGDAAGVGVALTCPWRLASEPLGRIGRINNAPMNSTDTQAAAKVIGSQRCKWLCLLVPQLVKDEG